MIPHISTALLPGVVSTHSLNGPGPTQVTERAYGLGVAWALGLAEIEYVNRAVCTAPTTPAG